MGERKKRHETETESLRSSSLRRDSVSATKTGRQTTQHVNVGCMSGIFHFMSKYHTRRKFLTSGKKPASESTKKPSPKPKNTTCQSDNDKKMSPEVILEIPRSPSIPAEIRRQSPTTSSNSPTASEKRRRLLGALEKCDEDLQALRRVIESVRGAGVQTPRTTPPCQMRGGAKSMEEEEEEESEEPSPVSVLDISHLVDRSPTNNRACSKRTRQEKSLLYQQQQLTRQCMSTKRPDEDDNIILQPLHLSAKIRPQFTIVPRTTATTSPTSRWSSATRDCVIEVCKAVELGQRLEVGSLVLVLEDVIFRDMVYEIIKEYYIRSLPFETSKRKLSF